MYIYFEIVYHDSMENVKDILVQGKHFEIVNDRKEHVSFRRGDVQIDVVPIFDSGRGPVIGIIVTMGRPQHYSSDVVLAAISQVSKEVLKLFQENTFSGIQHGTSRGMLAKALGD